MGLPLLWYLRVSDHSGPRYQMRVVENSRFLHHTGRDGFTVAQ